MKHMNAVIGIVSVAPLLFLFLLVVSMVIGVFFPISLAPALGDIFLVAGVLFIAMGTLLAFLAQLASRLMHRTIRNAVCADFMQGPYKYSRHPGALGLILMFVGLVLIMNSLPMAIIATVFILVETIWFIPMEEKVLMMQCEEGYREYQKKVRMWI